MGPDDYATREELALVVKTLFAKVGQQSAAIAARRANSHQNTTALGEQQGGG